MNRGLSHLALENAGRTAGRRWQRGRAAQIVDERVFSPTSGGCVQPNRSLRRAPNLRLIVNGSARPRRYTC